MNEMKRLLTGTAMAALVGAAIALTAGCVTINIYFPAAAAEKAADKIIDEVYRIDQGGGTTGDKPAVK